MLREPRRVILHVGLPKTGTTALQIWCTENRKQLDEIGVIYPELLGSQKTAKHDQMVRCLLTGNLDPIRDMTSKYSECNLLLSMEGLTNHLYDFQLSALEEFRRIFVDFEIDVFMVIRERSSWIRSVYKQSVINPPNERYHYATPLDLKAFAELPRVKRLADFASLKHDVQTAYGANRVFVANYEDGYMQEFFRIVGIKDNDYSVREQNTSVPDWMVEFVRQLNGYGLEPSARGAWLGALQSCFKTNHDMMQIYSENLSSKGFTALDFSILDKIETINEDLSDNLNLLRSFLQDG